MRRYLVCTMSFNPAGIFQDMLSCTLQRPRPTLQMRTKQKSIYAPDRNPCTAALSSQRALLFSLCQGPTAVALPAAMLPHHLCTGPVDLARQSGHNRFPLLRYMLNRGLIGSSTFPLARHPSCLHVLLEASEKHAGQQPREASFASS